MYLYSKDFDLIINAHVRRVNVQKQDYRCWKNEKKEKKKGNFHPCMKSTSTRRRRIRAVAWFSVQLAPRAAYRYRTSSLRFLSRPVLEYFSWKMLDCLHNGQLHALVSLSDYGRSNASHSHFPLSSSPVHLLYERTAN